MLKHGGQDKSGLEGKRSPLTYLLTYIHIHVTVAVNEIALTNKAIGNILFNFIFAL